MGPCVILKIQKIRFAHQFIIEYSYRNNSILPNNINMMSDPQFVQIFFKKNMNKKNLHVLPYW